MTTRKKPFWKKFKNRGKLISAQINLKKPVRQIIDLTKELSLYFHFFKFIISFSLNYKQRQPKIAEKELKSQKALFLKLFPLAPVSSFTVEKNSDKIYAGETELGISAAKISFKGSRGRRRSGRYQSDRLSCLKCHSVDHVSRFCPVGPIKSHVLAIFYFIF